MQPLVRRKESKHISRSSRTLASLMTRLVVFLSQLLAEGLFTLATFLCVHSELCDVYDSSLYNITYSLLLFEALSDDVAFM